MRFEGIDERDALWVRAEDRVQALESKAAVIRLGLFQAATRASYLRT